MIAADWLRMLALSLLWGATFLFAKVALAEVQPFTLVLSRVAIAALALAAFMALMGRAFTLTRPALLAFLGMGLLNNLIPFSLIFLGQRDLPAGLAAIFNATTPIFTVIVMHLFTSDERATPAKVAGVALGFLGVAALIGPAIVGLAEAPLLAVLFCLGGALSYGFSALFSRRFKALGIDATMSALGQVSATTLMMIPIVLVFDQPWNLPAPGAATLAAILALGLFSTALAYVVFFQIMASAGPSNLMLVTLLIPPSAILLGWAVLGESLAWFHFAGMGLIGLGLLAIDGRLAAVLKRRAGATRAGDRSAPRSDR